MIRLLCTRAGAQEVGDAAIFELLGGCKELCSLAVAGCVSLTDRAILCLRSVRIKTLDLSGLPNQSPVSLVDLVSCARHLTELRLASLYRLDDHWVSLMAPFLTGIVHLDFSSCCMLTETAVRCISTHCKMLVSILLLRCPRLTNRCVLLFAAECPLVAEVRLTPGPSISCAMDSQRLLRAWIPQTVFNALRKLEISSQRLIDTNEDSAKRYAQLSVSKAIQAVLSSHSDMTETVAQRYTCRYATVCDEDAFVCFYLEEFGAFMEEEYKLSPQLRFSRRPRVARTRTQELLQLSEKGKQAKPDFK